MRSKLTPYPTLSAGVGKTVLSDRVATVVHLSEMVL